MDPSMFALASGVLGVEFAVAKTAAAMGLGIFGGGAIYILSLRGYFTGPLREGIGNSGCGGSKIRRPMPITWRFWSNAERCEKIIPEAVKAALFLAQWLVLTFLLESLMHAYLPAEMITAFLGGAGVQPIALATLVGVPAYLK